jgi:ATPase subunit of ABC transporter with duplicated ATPase domains
MSSIQVQNITKAYGSKRLFEEVVVNFSPGRRYGLTGPNGAGKSTFMKILAGEIEPDNGIVSRPEKTSVLSQDQYAFEDRRVLDVVIMGNKRLWAAMHEKEACSRTSTSPTRRASGSASSRASSPKKTATPPRARPRRLLEGLGSARLGARARDARDRRRLKLRVLLAQALFGKPEALLLDEPTNNLDLDTIRWLEKFLQSYEGVLVTISHDRHFLNAICTHIADIDYETIIVYPGGYDDMVVAKGQVRSRIEQENFERSKKIAQLQEFVAKFGAGTRASQVQSRKRQIDKLSLNDLKRSNIQRPFIQLLVKKPSGKQTLTIEGLSKSWPEVKVHREVRRARHQGREDRHHRQERRRQDDALPHARR